MVGATTRGLSLEGIKEFTIGQIVDYCATWNKAHGTEDDQTKTHKRKATQSDWDAFLG